MSQEIKKVAKLVTVTLITRVIVNSDASDEQILEEAKHRFQDKIENELHDSLESIEDDVEVPFREDIDE